jgi:hypothetical protein
MYRLPPSLVNFLAGVAAAASVNLVTTVVTTNSREHIVRLIVAAVPWMLLSVSLALAAIDLETTRTDAERFLEASMTSDERGEVLAAAFAPHRRQVTWRVLLSAAALLTSVGTSLAVLGRGAA